MVKSFTTRLKDDIRKKIASIVYDTQRVIIENTPVDTGRLRSSIVVEKTSDGWIIGTNVKYAWYVEEGIGLFGPFHHYIVPKKAKVLHWTTRNGKDVFATRSSGFSGSHMFLKGFNYLKQELDKIKG